MKIKSPYLKNKNKGISADKMILQLSEPHRKSPPSPPQPIGRHIKNVLQNQTHLILQQISHENNC